MLFFGTYNFRIFGKTWSLLARYAEKTNLLVDTPLATRSVFFGLIAGRTSTTDCVAFGTFEESSAFPSSSTVLFDARRRRRWRLDWYAVPVIRMGNRITRW